MSHSFWYFVTIWVPPLVALWLCVRAAMSRDSQALRLIAVGAAFLPLFVPLLAGLWARLTHPPAGTRGTLWLDLYQYAPVVPAVYLLVWAFRTRDERWMRLLSAILGLLGLLLPLFVSWRGAMLG